jgi:hypothetical protein
VKRKSGHLSPGMIGVEGRQALRHLDLSEIAGAESGLPKCGEMTTGPKPRVSAGLHEMGDRPARARFPYEPKADEYESVEPLHPCRPAREGQDPEAPSRSTGSSPQPRRQGANR